jgi:carboxypeptidase Taq
MQAQAAYEELLRLAREEALLASCAALLGWDEETYLPQAGVQHRAAQQGLLAGMLHDRAAAPRVGELLAVVEGSALVRDVDSDAAANVRELRRLHRRSTRLPRSLVEEIARILPLSQQEWAAARQAADFARFRPWLEKIVALLRRQADCLGYEDHPYDALLDDYEPGTRTADLARLFADLRAELVPLANVLTYARRRPDLSLLRRDYPVDRQRALCELAAGTFGFDFRAGRLDTAVHPFCTAIGPGDCRITTRYCPHDLSDSLFAVLHETGHALYEQGLDPAHHGTPLGEAASVAVDESQARLWENTVGRSRGFWGYFYPIVRRLFPAALRDVRAEDFYFAINNVEATLIRVTADEVTYNLHILIRFELERALIAGELAAADLPAAWNAAYHHHLGVTPASDAEGCLQDGHWGAGMFGYFPTYTLGNLYAAQLFARARTDLGGPEEAFSRGDFGALLGWLRQRVHRQGGRYLAPRLIERVTGSALDHRPFIQALRGKYGELYQIGSSRA